MKKKTTILCALILSVFTLFSLASSGSNSSPRVISNGNSGSTGGTSATTQVQLVTPCQFSYNNVSLGIDTEYWDSIPNDTLGLYTLPNGQRYLVVGVRFRNDSNNDIFVSTMDFQVYADNRLCDEKVILNDNIETMATISSGREADIVGFYAVPNDANTVEIEYESSIFSDKVVITVGE